MVNFNLKNILNGHNDSMIYQHVINSTSSHIILATLLYLTIHNKQKLSSELKHSSGAPTGSGVISLLGRSSKINNAVSEIENNNAHSPPLSPPLVVTTVDSTKEEMEYYKRQEQSATNKNGWCESSIAGDE